MLRRLLERINDIKERKGFTGVMRSAVGTKAAT